MGPALILPLVDGVRVVVPDSLELITPYVLIEQQDWFEDEIIFLRRLLKPGQKVIDIGANYGVFTLSMARAVGSAGRVWSFEPAASTAAWLARGIEANDFTNVVLDRSAVSSACGKATLSLHPNAELNAIVRGVEATRGNSEVIELVTLDERMDFYGWAEIDFLKIDAEGEEANILVGGRRFFAALSPLVQYEVKAGNDLHLDLVDRFATLGYESFRLVPGRDLLVPFDRAAPADGYLLNLFACKRDRAATLAARGVLVDAGDAPALPRDGDYGWRRTIADLPYARAMLDVWEHTVAAGRSGDIERALWLYAVSKDAALPAVTRFAALDESFAVLVRKCEREPSFLRLASLARVARELGARSVAVDALNRLCTGVFQRQQIDPTEPFLAPDARFDAVPPGPHLGNWVLAATLEELERAGSFSSFYTGESARGRLQTIVALGFAGPEIRRRLDLVERRFGASPPS